MTVTAKAVKPLKRHYRRKCRSAAVYAGAVDGGQMAFRIPVVGHGGRMMAPVVARGGARVRDDGGRLASCAVAGSPHRMMMTLGREASGWRLPTTVVGARCPGTGGNWQRRAGG